MRTWIKLYTEILHDPKMHALTDKQFRACINLFALAGYLDKDGLIGTADDIKFHLRLPRRAVESTLKRLTTANILQFDEPNYTVTAFLKRNGIAPSQSNEKVLQRVQAFRARKQAESETCNEDVTPLQSECNEDVTTLDKKRIDKKREAQDAPTPTQIQIYRKAAHKFPNKSLWDVICQTVPDTPESLELFERVIVGWIAKGWNPSNVTGQLECYKRGEIPGQNGNTASRVVGVLESTGNPMLDVIAEKRRNNGNRNTD